MPIPGLFWCNFCVFWVWSKSGAGGRGFLTWGATRPYTSQIDRRSAVNRRSTQIGGRPPIEPTGGRSPIDPNRRSRSGARCMEIPEQCSRVDKQERCSLCGNPEIYSRMETVERSSQVGRVERGREGRKKRVVQQKSTGREGRPKWVAQQKTWGIGTARRARRRGARVASLDFQSRKRP